MTTQPLYKVPQYCGRIWFICYGPLILLIMTTEFKQQVKAEGLKLSSKQGKARLAYLVAQGTATSNPTPSMPANSGQVYDWIASCAKNGCDPRKATNWDLMSYRAAFNRMSSTQESICMAVFANLDSE